MILTCPSCQARYVVPDSAIGPAGRKVRCAGCRHSWFQDPPELVVGSEAAAASLPAPPFAAPLSRSAPAPAERRSFERREPVQASAPEWDRTPVPEPPPFRPRRNPARIWTIAAVIAALLMTGAAFAIQYVGVDVGRWVGIPVQTGEVLGFADQNVRTTRLESGNAVLEVSGSIVNQTDQPQRVPQILAELKDANNRVIYSWSIAPPVAELPPRGRVPFNSANVGAPPGGRQLSLTFGTIS